MLKIKFVVLFENLSIIYIGKVEKPLKIGINTKKLAVKREELWQKLRLRKLLS